tara:strand:- start:670 stop:810 length:141 start_codon:yes stop_codon:yes gene_type:complete
MQKMKSTGIRLPPPAVAKLEVEFLAVLEVLVLPSPLIIGGKSLGEG